VSQAQAKLLDAEAAVEEARAEFEASQATWETVGGRNKRIKKGSHEDSEVIDLT